MQTGKTMKTVKIIKNIKTHKKTKKINTRFISTLAAILLIFPIFSIFSDNTVSAANNKSDSVSVPILMYHHLVEVESEDEVTENTIVSAETFESHIKALADDGYTGISFDQLTDYVENDGELPEKPIIITFDDGYLSNYEIAFPILQKYEMKATIFIIGISVGKDTYRDTNDEEYSIIPRFSYEQANEMIQSGLISIQSHSYDMHHWKDFELILDGEFRKGVLPLEDESEEDYRANFTDDFNRAKLELETAVETELTVYAYPYGFYSELSETLLKELGIKVTLTVYSGINIISRNKPETLYLLKRFTINNMPAQELLAMLSGDTDNAENAGNRSKNGIFDNFLENFGEFRK
jgi:peptidoglycan/xylan/chitin deacetylase (PgdA/CDA1 family)